jgi:hypothetical protein
LQNLFGLDVDLAAEDGEGGEARIWVWGDGEEADLGNVKKSWEALEVSLVASTYYTEFNDSSTSRRIPDRMTTRTMTTKRKKQKTARKRIKGTTMKMQQMMEWVGRQNDGGEKIRPMLARRSDGKTRRKKESVDFT